MVEVLALWLRQMAEASSLAISYVDGLQQQDFLSDTKTQQAVTMNLIVIGEIAGRILTEYPEFARDHTQIPWREMKGMRNRIAHGYFTIDLKVVWTTTTTALPNLSQSLLALLTGPDA